MTLWIKEPLAILADGATRGLVIENTTILECVPGGREPSCPVQEVFDAREHVILPGLINTHHHFYQNLTRAFPPAMNQSLFPWLTALYPIWQHLTPDHFRYAVRLAMAELLLSGCTTTTDHHYLFPTGMDEAIDIEIAEARALGIRVLLTRGSMSVSQDDGGLPPRSVVQAEGHILLHCEDLLRRYHETAPGAMVQIALAPCSPFSVSKQLMRESATLARRYGARLHTHLAETEDELNYCQDTFGCRTVDYLEDLGWLSPDVWLAHGVHFDPGEVTRLGQAGVGVSHCPSSNMVLASGLCPAVELEMAGCGVGLGVDGSASNDSSNMMQEVRQALLLQRLRCGAERVTHADALRWATTGSARCLGRADIGEITVGRQADLALFKLDEPRFSGHGDPIAALVLCGAHRADRVMVGGHWAVLDGRLPNLDLTDLQRRHQAAAANLQSHFGIG